MSERLDVYEFGKQLIRTKDLDPVYVVLQHAQLPPRKLQRWLLAYWCFYHAGTASWIAHGADGYWERMELAAGSSNYPRCPERRHFRGRAARESVEWLKGEGVDRLFQSLRTAGPALEDVMKCVRGWRGFGPWIAFKVADMLERLDLAPVRFTVAGVFLFDSPLEGARLLWATEQAEASEASREASEGVLSREAPEGVGDWAVGRILERLGTAKAPPRYERPIGVQEAETILCKWKSHMSGRYHVGEDIASLKRSLLRFARVTTSQSLLAAGVGARLW